MSIKTLPTTHHHIFCISILNFKVIVKSIKDPDDNFQRNLTINGLTLNSSLTFFPASFSLPLLIIAVYLMSDAVPPFISIRCLSQAHSPEPATTWSIAWHAMRTSLAINASQRWLTKVLTVPQSPPVVRSSAPMLPVLPLSPDSLRPTESRTGARTMQRGRLTHSHLSCASDLTTLDITHKIKTNLEIISRRIVRHTRYNKFQWKFSLNSNLLWRYFIMRQTMWPCSWHEWANALLYLVVNEPGTCHARDNIRKKVSKQTLFGVVRVLWELFGGSHREGAGGWGSCQLFKMTPCEIGLILWECE